MKIEAQSPSEYLSKVPEDKQIAIQQLYSTIQQSIPSGFLETMSYGMIGWVVPHSKYPDGYHCDPKLPLPFLSIAAQKNFIGFYHMGIYAQPDLLKWFQDEYVKRVGKKADMGKSCLRIKKMTSEILDLISELVSKMSPDDWIQLYESQYKKKG